MKCVAWLIIDYCLNHHLVSIVMNLHHHGNYHSHLIILCCLVRCEAGLLKDASDNHSNDGDGDDDGDGDGDGDAGHDADHYGLLKDPSDDGDADANDDD